MTPSVCSMCYLYAVMSWTLCLQTQFVPRNHDGRVSPEELSKWHRDITIQGALLEKTAAVVLDILAMLKASKWRKACSK